MQKNSFPLLNRVLFILALALFFFVHSGVSADSIYMRSGSRIKGKIVGQTRRIVRVRLPNGTVRNIFKRNIRRITYTDAAAVRRAEAAKRRAEERKRKAEEARRKREQEIARAAELKRQREEEKQRLEEARRQAKEKLKREAEKRRQDEIKRKNDEKVRRQLEEKARREKQRRIREEKRQKILEQSRDKHLRRKYLRIRYSVGNGKLSSAPTVLAEKFTGLQLKGQALGGGNSQGGSDTTVGGEVQVSEVKPRELDLRYAGQRMFIDLGYMYVPFMAGYGEVEEEIFNGGAGSSTSLGGYGTEKAFTDRRYFRIGYHVFRRKWMDLGPYVGYSFFRTNAPYGFFAPYITNDGVNSGSGFVLATTRYDAAAFRGGEFGLDMALHIGSRHSFALRLGLLRMKGTMEYFNGKFSLDADGSPPLFNDEVRLNLEDVSMKGFDAALEYRWKFYRGWSFFIGLSRRKATVVAGGMNLGIVKDPTRVANPIGPSSPAVLGTLLFTLFPEDFTYQETFSSTRIGFEKRFDFK